LTVPVQDKGGNIYSLNNDYYLNHGLNTSRYYLKSTKNPATIFDIYKSEWYGDGSGCPSKEGESKTYLRRATIVDTYVQEYEGTSSDIALSFFAIERDCKTLKEDTVVVKLRSLENGFKIERQTLKGE
jgi:hypothetical protein